MLFSTFIISKSCHLWFIGGPGCSEKLCSSANAWFGSVGQSHGGLIECAGVGDCNRRTGICRYAGQSSNISLAQIKSLILEHQNLAIAVVTGELFMVTTVSTCRALLIPVEMCAGRLPIRK